MPMRPYDALVSDWNAGRARMAESPVFRRMADGTLTRQEYGAILRQIFHHARENPQLQALVTARFRGEQRRLVSAFCRHAISEVGHDELALADLAALGEDVSRIPDERPLPATFALLASAFHMVEHHRAVAYVGYLFQLEYTPVQIGPQVMASLERCGIPRTAMSFIEEHARVDVSHCQLIRNYVEQLLRTPADLDDALYLRRITADGYLRMLEQAVESAHAPDAEAEFEPREPVGRTELERAGLANGRTDESVA
jgi:pyrroloquinoline quinone (PQQ) biosynthesis protein C